MVFTSHIFLFYFLPAVLLIYYLIPGRRNEFLLLASYAFYGWWRPWFIGLMLAVTLINYLAGMVIATSEPRSPRARAALTLSVVGSLGLLGFFKYFVFAEENLNRLLAAFEIGTIPVVEVLLPIGISFYIFQSLSYTADVYRRVSPPVRSFWDFACYVSLFPQLIAGPIVRYNTIADQLVERRHTLEKFSSGAALFILGFAKKIVLANPMGEMADTVFAAEAPCAPDAWLGVTAYAFQIYFDFSGYSDMAIGLGRMLGFEFPRNFDAPYRAVSITDFWRRWHISLSSWLRDYLYVPLGGNRKGNLRTYANLMTTMLLGGLWHGASWTFVVWGGLHGLYLAAERWLKARLGDRAIWSRFSVQVLLAVVTYFLINITWVFFRAGDFATAWRMIVTMLTFVTDGEKVLPTVHVLETVITIGIMLVVHWYMRERRLDEEVRRMPVWLTGLVWGVMITLIIITQGGSDAFIYFQF